MFVMSRASIPEKISVSDFHSLPLLSKLLPWAWVNVFFVFHDFHSHLDNSYHNRHDLSTIIIIILHHHDLKSIISFKQTRLFWRHIKTPCQLVNNASSSPTFFIIMEYVLSYHNAHLTFPLMIIIIKPRGFSRKYSVLGFKWNEFLFLWFLSWKINLYIFFYHTVLNYTILHLRRFGMLVSLERTGWALTPSISTV